MDTEERLMLIERNTEEVMTKEDLKILLDTGEKLEHYIGFEISGLMHLGTGIMCSSKIKDFLDAGAHCRVFLADWHTWINNKLGGDLETIKKVAGGYFTEGFKASLKCVGADAEDVDFVLGSDLYHNNDRYWQTMIDVSKNTSLARINRSITIMGRKEGEAVDFAQLIYPAMQVADIFIQGLNLPHAGLDQRKAQVIAREVAGKLKFSSVKNKAGAVIKPVAVHHHLILGLQKPPIWPVPKDKIQELWSSMKMSKSIPGSAIFIHDSEEEIRKKLKNAFCPEKIADFNPVLDWAKYLTFVHQDSLELKRPEKFGGDAVFESYTHLERAFVEGKIHPLDLKNAVAEFLIDFLKPAREHFEKPKARAMKEELEQMKITR